MKSGPAEFPTDDFLPLLERALHEDLGSFTPSTDLTSAALFHGLTGKAVIIAREPLTVCGLPAASAVFRRLDSRLEVTELVKEGAEVADNQEVLSVTGNLQAILAAERTALNFLQHLSGISSGTKRLVRALAGTKCAVVDTRKTIPGWRLLEKYAVRVGGGCNNRIGLYDEVLIKNNHLDALGITPAAAVRESRAKSPSGTFVMVEVRNRAELESAIEAVPDAILLDNVPPSELQELVGYARSVSPQIQLEASGGITEANALAYAKTGVNSISLGAITHSSRSADLSLRFRKT